MISSVRQQPKSRVTRGEFYSCPMCGGERNDPRWDSERIGGWQDGSRAWCPECLGAGVVDAYRYASYSVDDRDAAVCAALASMYLDPERTPVRCRRCHLGASDERSVLPPSPSIYAERVAVRMWCTECRVVTDVGEWVP